MEPSTSKGQSSQFPEFTEKNRSKSGPKVPMDPHSLFKMNIGDLLELGYDAPTQCFKFKNNVLSKIECGGEITDVFRDDDKLFSFVVDDGSGSIQCFHKYKHDRASLMKTINELTDRSSPSTPSTMSLSNESSIFDVTKDDSVVKNSETDARQAEAVGEVLSWFYEEIVAKQKSPKVGDLIHIQGHLIEDDDNGTRKINVLDFRIPTKEEHKDLKMEIRYLHSCVY